MTRRESIHRSAGKAGDDVMVIRCRGRRIAAVAGPSRDGSWTLTLVVPRDGRGAGAVTVFSERPSEWAYIRGGEWIPYDESDEESKPHNGHAACPNHPEGHTIDPGRLDSVLELRRGRWGKPSSEDIGRVEVADR